MITEHHFNDTFVWPKGVRLTVGLTFDLQGGEPVQADSDGIMNLEDYATGEYGPNTGAWRLLEMLDKEDIKATFLTCGGIAERYPDLVKSIVARGHEVAGHGYHHEIARKLKIDDEREVVRKTIAMLKSVAGYRPSGWRTCTQSTNTNDLLFEHDFQWNSNSFSHDLPFLWEKDGKVLVELPRHPFGDGRVYGHSDTGIPSNALAIWKAAFDELHAEANDRATYLPFQIHPYISGRPGRTQALRETIQYMKKAQGVWFATGSEIATWCLNEVFKKGSAKTEPRKIAIAS